MFKLATLALSLWITSAVHSRPLFREASLSFLNGTSGTPGIGSTSNNLNNNNNADSGLNNTPSTPRRIRSTTNPFIQNGRVPVYTSCADSGTFAMTFRDGTQPSQRGIANLLNRNHAKGTFFVNGMNWRCIYDPEMVDILRATYAAGHQIGNHGWGHDHSSQLSRDDFDNQVEWVNEALEKILGIRPALFRPPYGDYNDVNLQVLAARNFSAAVNWDHVSGSGTGTSLDASNAMYAQVARTYPTPHVVLQHEQDTGTPDQILPDAIRQLQAAGYRLVTLSECLNIPPYQWVGRPQQRDETWTCAGKPGPGQPHRH